MVKNNILYGNLGHFSIQAQKIKKKSTQKKNSLYFRKWNFLALIFKKYIYIFLSFQKQNMHFAGQARRIKKIHPKKISHNSWNRSPKNTSHIFSKESFSYISGNGNPKKFLIFQEVPFQDQKVKKLLVFQEATSKVWKSKKNYTFSYKEAKFSILKYFLIIIKWRFFTIDKLLFFFHLLTDFVTFSTILSLFFFFFFKKILIPFTSFFLVFLYFLDNI